MAKRVILEQSNKEIVTKYNELKSSYKVASFFNASPTVIKRILKEEDVLRSQSNAAKERDNSYLKGMKRTKETKKKLSDIAKQRTGCKNPFYGKSHTEEAKRKIGKQSKLRVGKRNPNYKDGSYVRRERDYKIQEMKPLRKSVFIRDNHTCKLCNKRGGELHAHHLIPFWVKKECYLDEENLITVCSTCHSKKAHLGNRHKFNVEIIPEELLEKYSIHAERLSEKTP